ncbi:uncharacterized protein L969DRAFT_15203 [Mixia osmundae IAM 14324]|uniref:uncharacterized protein n=1 Tax=Mixia osmundae (strain CBS 9802 / IAM 14324 / JCM 22182 / KY 12970) TaxID=764103 RepID=UPI0004A55719|nr:uncharacterized protein L969DRAFT_15203 [Mixia osmundae IAM 14324]KEI41177.1 hypothetical protein L969DRAFT_15203 [Mixia osmundae IAM 14324]
MATWESKLDRERLDRDRERRDADLERERQAFYAAPQPRAPLSHGHHLHHSLQPSNGQAGQNGQSGLQPPGQGTEMGNHLANIYNSVLPRRPSGSPSGARQGPDSSFMTDQHRNQDQGARQESHSGMPASSRSVQPEHADVRPSSHSPGSGHGHVNAYSNGQRANPMSMSSLLSADPDSSRSKAHDAYAPSKPKEISRELKEKLNPASMTIPPFRHPSAGGNPPFMGDRERDSKIKTESRSMLDGLRGPPLNGLNAPHAQTGKGLNYPSWNTHSAAGSPSRQIGQTDPPGFGRDRQAERDPQRSATLERSPYNPTSSQKRRKPSPSEPRQHQSPVQPSRHTSHTHLQPHDEYNAYGNSGWSNAPSPQQQRDAAFSSAQFNPQQRRRQSSFDHTTNLTSEGRAKAGRISPNQIIMPSLHRNAETMNHSDHGRHVGSSGHHRSASMNQPQQNVYGQTQTQGPAPPNWTTLPPLAQPQMGVLPNDYFSSDPQRTSEPQQRNRGPHSYHAMGPTVYAEEPIGHGHSRSASWHQRHGMANQMQQRHDDHHSYGYAPSQSSLLGQSFEPVPVGSLDQRMEWSNRVSSSKRDHRDRERDSHHGSPSHSNHKRKRSDHPSNTAFAHLPPHGLPPASYTTPLVEPDHPIDRTEPRPTSPPVQKREGPLYTVGDLEKARLQPPLLRVDNQAILDAMAAVSSSTNETPHLGSYRYSPFVGTAEMLPAEVLQRFVGGRFEMIIDTCWLNNAGLWSVSVQGTLDAPQEAGSVIASGGEKVKQDWSFWDLKSIRECQVWGTDVYTDDSDVLAMCLHSNWLKFSDSPVSESASKNHEAIAVTVRVAPRLLVYAGSLRNGLQSRSWGNSHDGVSLYIESIKATQDRRAGRRRSKAFAHLGESARGRIRLGFGGPVEVIPDALAVA